MDLKERTDLYNAVISKLGTIYQITMAIQELAELIKELTNVLVMRNERIIDLPGEIADVQIMLEQLILIFNNAASVELRRNEKLLRLKGLVDHVK